MKKIAVLRCLRTSNNCTGSGFVIAKELMNRTIKTTDDVANYLDLPVLGSVPDYESLNKNMKKEQQEQSLTARLRRYLWKR